MITGFNTDVPHQDQVYHVQTEDRGTKDNPVLESLVYIGGTIIAKKLTPYADKITQGANEATIASLLKRQHQVIIAAIKAGRIEDLIKHSGIYNKEKSQTPLFVKEEAFVAVPEAKPEFSQKGKSGFLPEPQTKGKSGFLPEFPQKRKSGFLPQAKKSSGSLLTPEKPKRSSGSLLTPEKPKRSSGSLVTTNTPEKPVLPAAQAKRSSGPLSNGGSLPTPEKAKRSSGSLAPAINPEKPAIPRPSPSVPKLVRENSGLLKTGSLNLDEVISDYLKRSSEQEKLDLKVIAPSVFIAGKTITLRIDVKQGEKAEPDAIVTVKVIGTAFKPQVFIGRAAADGIATFNLALPAFSSGTAAIVIEVQSRYGRGELKHLIRRA